MKSATLSNVQVVSIKDLVIPNPSEVNSYLTQHPDLSSILPALAKAVQVEFPKTAQLTLEVYHDPEIDDHYLTLVVRLPAYDKNTMKRIDAIWGQFEKKIGKSSGLTLTTDFRVLVPPK